ncbi:MAG: hypothetical protein Q9212_007551, partial [Teloschistes hypoglaucus]
TQLLSNNNDFLGTPGAHRPEGGAEEDENLFMPPFSSSGSPAPGRQFDGVVPGSMGPGPQNEGDDKEDDEDL